MEKEELMDAQEFCRHYQVEYSFITALHESGLIEITTVEEKGFIPESQVPELEKLSRLHYDLHINVEGIEAISHLLQKNKGLQSRLAQLEERLRIYESWVRG